jgi:hypothetical protein
MKYRIKTKEEAMQFYLIGGPIIKAIMLDKFGKEKLLILIKSIRPGLTEDSFREFFRKVYSFDFTEEGLKTII